MIVDSSAVVAVLQPGGRLAGLRHRVAQSQPSADVGRDFRTQDRRRSARRPVGVAQARPASRLVGVEGRAAHSSSKRVPLAQPIATTARGSGHSAKLNLGDFFATRLRTGQQLCSRATTSGTPTSNPHGETLSRRIFGRHARRDALLAQEAAWPSPSAVADTSTTSGNVS